MNNSEILGEEAAVRQIVENDFSATNGVFEDDSVTKIKGHAFHGCTALTEAYLPNATKSVVSQNVWQSTFYDCTALTKVYLPKATGKLSYTFFNTGALDVYIPLITECAGYSFRYSKLSRFTGDHIQRVSSNDFRNCTNLTFVDLPVCTYLGQNILSSDTNLVTVILRNSSLCSLEISAFDSTKYATNGAGGAYVYVPRDLISTYQSATNWATLYAAHNDMFRALEDYTVDGTTTGEFIYAQTPKTPMSVRDNEVVYTRGNAITYVTTTADGKVTLNQNDTGLGINTVMMISPASLGSAIFYIPVGSTLTVVYADIVNNDNTDVDKTFGLVDVSGNMYCARNLRRETGNIVRQSYTNNTNSPIGIGGVRFNQSYMRNANASFEVSITAFVDGERYI